MSYSDVKFDFLMSIGRACRTRFQLERMWKQSHSAEEFPSFWFDYLMSGGISGVTKIIENDFRIHSSEFVLDDYNIPFHHPTGFHFLHDFGSSKAVRGTRDVAMRHFLDAMPTALEKFRYLGEKTNSLLQSGGNIGCVYHGEMQLRDLEKLLWLLKTRYKRDFVIINVVDINEALDPFSMDQVITLKVDDSSTNGTPDEWMGCNESWDHAFRDFRICH